MLFLVDAKSPNPDLVIDVVVRMWAWHGADEHVFRYVTLVLHLYWVHFLSLKRLHLLLVMDQMEPRFVHTDRVETMLERLAIPADLVEHEVEFVLRVVKRRLGAICR